MKKRAAVLVMIMLSILSGCNKLDQFDTSMDKEDCSRIRCAAYWSYFKFKLIDKNTGANLLAGAAPVYSFNEVKLYSDKERVTPIQLLKDSTTGDVKLITLLARDTMYLVLRNERVYTLQARFQEQDCCSNRVHELTVNNSRVCTSCAEVIAIKID